MKRFPFQLPFLFSALIFISFVSYAHSISGLSKEAFTRNVFINSINGIVYDPHKRPVSDLYVELLSDTNFSVSRTRTSGVGRFVFEGIRGGRYRVRVQTTGTDFLEQSQEVELIPLFEGGSDQQFLEFNLRYDSRKVNLGSGGAPEQIFVQEGIPDDARNLYKRGAKLLENNNDRGLQELEKALKIFPNYYDALITTGQEYVRRKEYQKSLPFLIKSIYINQRSYDTFYNLGYACFQLRQLPEALEASRAATILKPASSNAQLLYGTVLRLSGKFQESEKALLLAKSASKIPIPQLHYQLALLYNRTKRNKEVISELETYLKLLPNAAEKKEVEDLINRLRNVRN